LALAAAATRTRSSCAVWATTTPPSAWPGRSHDGHRQDHHQGSDRRAAFLTRALKAPSLREAAGRLAERARAEGWTHEEFLAACLQREVAARESHGGEGRIRQARFPARKSLEEFDLTTPGRSSGRRSPTLAQLDFLREATNVVFLGPSGTP
jgi:DNA replication protein DnaC